VISEEAERCFTFRLNPYFHGLYIMELNADMLLIKLPDIVIMELSNV